MTIIDFNDLYNRCVEELQVIDIPISKRLTHIEFNDKLKTAFGQCVFSNGFFHIEFNKILLKDNINEKTVRETIYHELIHTIDGCFNHGKKFQYYADLVNDCYSVNIGTYVSTESMCQTLKAREEIASWIFECPTCHKKFLRYRKPNWLHTYNNNTMLTDNASCANCKCGKGLKIIKYTTLTKVRQVS